LRLQQEHV